MCVHVCACVCAYPITSHLLNFHAITMCVRDGVPGYPLVNYHTSMELAIFDRYINHKWPRSIGMLVYWRVFPINIPISVGSISMNHPQITLKSAIRSSSGLRCSQSDVAQGLLLGPSQNPEASAPKPGRQALESTARAWEKVGR